MGFLGIPLGWIMYAIFNLINNYGWSLILFVVLTKVALFPLSIKQQKSTARMASFQPKLQQLQKQYGKNKEKYQEEMMKLYESEGVSPTAGCLPMLVQFALLFGIVDVIYKPLKHILRVPKELIAKATEIVGVTSSSEIKIISEVQAGTNSSLNSLFPADILENITNFNMDFMGIDFGAVPTLGFNLLVLIPIISGVTALLMTIIQMRQQERNGQTMQGPMKYMMYITPLISVWIGFTLPAGVGIYWIVSNIVQMVIMLILHRVYTPERLAHENNKNKDKNREKMRKKREKLAAYNQMMSDKGKANSSNSGGQKQIGEDDTVGLKEKELAKKRLAEARRKMAEKYGEEYNED